MQNLHALYETERRRLCSLAAEDMPQGEYASPVFGCGHERADVMLIGEAPGAEETKAARPFVGKAGKQLDALLERAGIVRDELYVTNVVKYRPVVRSTRSVRNRTPSTKEIQAGLPLLQQEILHVSPMIIVTLGNTPLGAVLTLAKKQKDVVGNLHGRPIPITMDNKEFILFALYHPASGIYNRSLISVMEEDACRLGEHLVKAL